MAKINESGLDTEACLCYPGGVREERLRRKQGQTGAPSMGEDAQRDLVLMRDLAQQMGEDAHPGGQEVDKVSEPDGPKRIAARPPACREKGQEGTAITRDQTRRYEALKDAADLVAEVGERYRGNREDAKQGGPRTRLRVEMRLLRQIEDLEDAASSVPLHRARSGA